MKVSTGKKSANLASLSATLACFSSRPSSVKNTANPVLRRRRISQPADERVALNATMPEKGTSPVDDCGLSTVSVPRVPRVQLKPRRSASFEEVQPLAVEQTKAERKTRKPRKKKVCWRKAYAFKESTAKGFYPRIIPAVSEAIFDFQAILNVTNGKLIF